MSAWVDLLRSQYNWNLNDRITQYNQQFIQGDYCCIKTKAEAVEFLFAASNSVRVDEKTSKFFDIMNHLDHYLLCENQAKRGV